MQIFRGFMLGEYYIATDTIVGIKFYIDVHW